MSSSFKVNAEAAVAMVKSVTDTGNPGGVSIFGNPCGVEGCGSFTHPGKPKCPVHAEGSLWQEKDGVQFCEHCFQEFHVLTRRRHHCRCCGGVFCADCVDYQPAAGVTLPLHKEGEHSGEIRVCIACASVLRPGIVQKMSANPLYKNYRHLPLDLVFCFDATTSMDSHIHKVEHTIAEIVDDIHRHHYVDMHLGAVGYRDHQYGDTICNFIAMQNHHKKFEKLVYHIDASFGPANDIPEALPVGLALAQRLTWRPQAVKMLLIITDAPPHGVGYQEDDYPNGDPNGLDSYALTDSLVKDGVSIYTIGVEPLATETGANKILQDLANRGHGFHCSLEDHGHLHHQIAALACTLTMRGIVSEELVAANGDGVVAAQAAFARMKSNTMPQITLNTSGVMTDFHRQPLTADRIYSEFVVPGNLPPAPVFSRYN